MSKGLVLYHNCLEFFEILNLKKVKDKYAAWDKFAITSTDIISARDSSKAATSESEAEASAIPYLVADTKKAVSTPDDYASLIKGYLSAQNGKEARLTVMYGAGDKDCLKPIRKALEDIYKENSSFDLKLLKLEVVTCKYSQDMLIPHDASLGATAYKSTESRGGRSKNKKNPQNDLIRLCSSHAVPFCLKYPICYVNLGVFVKDKAIRSTDEIAYFQNYHEVSTAPSEESFGRYAMKIHEDFLEREDDIIKASKKRPGTIVGFYNQHYLDYVGDIDAEKRASIEARLIVSTRADSKPADSHAGTFGVGAGGIARFDASKNEEENAEHMESFLTRLEVARFAESTAEEVASYSPTPSSVDRLEAPSLLTKKGKS